MDHLFLQVALLFATGLLFSLFAKKVKLPSVTGYLVGGLLVGPNVLNLVSHHTLETLMVFSNIALGFIAFSIGSEFKISYFKKVGVTPVVIAFLEAVGAVMIVTGVMLLLGNDLSFSLMIGSIASATAPAATIMVIRQYKAKGPVSETLLSVVAIDDAAALICFGFALAITNNLNNANSNMLEMLLSPFIEIIVSLVIGLALGLLLSYVIRYFKDNANRNSLVIAIILLALGLSVIFHASSLLVCMVLGAVYCNLSTTSEKVMQLVDEMTPPLFMLFFVLSGAELNPAIIPTIGVLGSVYIIARVIGKYLGSYAGAVVTKAPENVRKYLGPCLIPQAGVAIGLSLIAQAAVPSHGQTIRAIILCATLIYELVGPYITKVTLQKAQEIASHH